MAKLIGPIGSKMRGKVGQIVAAKTVGGDTVIRSYQPQVKNPKTLRQRVSRNKLKVASGLAAIFADVIGIGYAKAVAGAKMYARNMFVKNVVPVNAGVLSLNGETPVVAWDMIPLSKAVGLTAKPVVTMAEGTEAGSMKATLTNADAFPLGAGERLGFVVIGWNSNSGVQLTKVGEASTGVTFSAQEMATFEFDGYTAFVKVIPEAYNGIVANDVPWKYPSNTSASVFVG